MADSLRVPNGLVVDGQIICTDIVMPAGSVGNAAIETDADIDYTKVTHLHQATYSEKSTTTVTDGNYVIGYIHGASATVVAVYAGNVTDNTGSNTVDVDVTADGTSVLTSKIELAAGSPGDNAAEAGTLHATNRVLSQNAVLKVDIDQATGSGDCQGIWVTVYWSEDPNS